MERSTAWRISGTVLKRMPRSGSFILGIKWKSQGLKPFWLPLVCASQLHVLVSCTCWSVARAGQLYVLVNCKCWSIVRAGQLYVLVSCTCWSIVRAGQLYVLVNCTCWSVVRAGQLYVLVSCTCWSIVRAGQLYVLVNCTCWSVVRAGQLYVLVSWIWGSKLLSKTGRNALWHVSEELWELNKDHVLKNKTISMILWLK